MIRTATRPLTVDDIEAGYDNDAWLGYGYLGGRQNALDGLHTRRERATAEAMVEAADTLVLAEANRRGWTRTRFFEWANSKPGRWTADELIGSPIDVNSGAKVARYMEGF